MTDLERLHVWMERNNLDEPALRAGLRYIRSIEKVLDGTKPLTDSFRWRFGLHFGNEAMREVFQIDFGDDRSRFEAGFQDRLWYPEKYAANQAVANAVNRGELPAASTLLCHGCHKRARDYHHPSYRPNDRLNVIPLCKSCHTKAHNGSLNVPFGVVPTHVGLVRIAVSIPRV